MGIEARDQNFDDTGRTDGDLTNYETTVGAGQIDLSIEVDLGITEIDTAVTYNNAISEDGTYAPVTGTFDEIMTQLNTVDVAAIGKAQLAWKYAAEALSMVGDERLPRIAEDMATAWSGTAAAEAQQALQITAATAVALKNESVHMGNTTDYAHEMAAHYTAQENRVGYGHLKTGSDDKVAQDYLQRYMDRYTEALEIAPKEVQAQIKMVDPGRWSQEDLTSSANSDGGGNVSSRVGSTGGYGGSTGTSFVDSTSAGDSYTVDRSLFGSDGSLAGSGRAGGLGGLLGTGGSGLGGGSSTGSGSATALGLGATGFGAAGLGASGAAATGKGVVSRGGLFPTGGGATGGGAAGRSAALSPEALSNGRAGAASAPGAGGMMAAPMGAGGQSREEEERERYAWLMEDEDFWGAKTDAPPPIITE